MSGSVGATKIRSDIRQSVRDKTPSVFNPALQEQQGRIRSAYVLSPEERARTTGPANVTDFYDLFKKTLEFAAENDGISYQIKFSTDHPPDPAELPCFSGTLIDRGPLVLNGREETAPRFMQEYPDPDYPGEQIQEFYIRQQNLIRITVWARTKKVSYELAEWVENKYWDYLWALQWGGLGHPVQWRGRESDVYKEIREQPMFGCPINFFVITGRITKQRSTTLKKLHYSIGILDETS